MYAFNLVSSDAGQYKCRAEWSADDMEIDSDQALLLPAGQY